MWHLPSSQIPAQRPGCWTSRLERRGLSPHFAPEARARIRRPRSTQGRLPLMAAHDLVRCPLLLLSPWLGFGPQSRLTYQIDKDYGERLATPFDLPPALQHSVAQAGLLCALVQRQSFHCVSPKNSLPRNQAHNSRNSAPPPRVKLQAIRQIRGLRSDAQFQDHQTSSLPLSTSASC